MLYADIDAFLLLFSPSKHPASITPCHHLCEGKHVTAQMKQETFFSTYRCLTVYLAVKIAVHTFTVHKCGSMVTREPAHRERPCTCSYMSVHAGTEHASSSSVLFVSCSAPEFLCFLFSSDMSGTHSTDYVQSWTELYCTSICLSVHNLKQQPQKPRLLPEEYPASWWNSGFTGGNRGS